MRGSPSNTLCGECQYLISPPKNPGSRRWVASAAVRCEEGLDELLGPERAKVVQLLSDADVAERNPQLFCNPDDDAPL